MRSELNLEQLFTILDQHGVKYILVGMMAAVTHGADYPTYDIDITPALSEDNMDRLSAALRDMDARIRVEGTPEGFPFDHDGDSLSRTQVWNLTTKYGDVDLCLVPSGTTGYQDMVRDAESKKLFGVLVQVASLADVIRSKQAANRPKDQRVLPALRELLSKTS